MKNLTERIRQSLKRLFSIAIIMLLSCILLLPPTHAKAPSGETHLLTISICPPDNLHISIEVCENTAEIVAESFTQALSIPSQNVTSLVNENAQGDMVLIHLAAYGKVLNENDTLIVYLNAHGSRYSDWLMANVPNPEIRNTVSGTLPMETYALQFWSEESVGLPPVALSNHILVPLDDIMAVLGAIPARVALIIDSCYAELAVVADRPKNLELLVVASGSEQVANVTENHNSSLFGFALAGMLSHGDFTTLGDALSAAGTLTTELARDICGRMTVSQDVFDMILPAEPLPSEVGEDGKVALPDWYCVQVPATHAYGNAIMDMPVQF